MSEAPSAFGKYFLAEKIATGGMAEIYLAKLLGPSGFEKQLIIKQIHPQFGERREFVELFVAEAKTLVSLSHGNIVPIYELGVVDDTYFIAMEYIDGPTLAQLLDARKAPLEPGVAAYVCAELLKGLDYAHRKGAGVIHRDLSPRNVMLSRDGEVKIVDFGIAATVGDDVNARDSGRPAGSFPYMSPEQVRREPLDTRTDLFSAGILLWECLTARRLFERDTDDATLDAVLHGDIPPPSHFDSAVPPALDELCERALQRDRDARFADAGAFLQRLTRFLYSVDPPVTPSALSALVARTCPPVPRTLGEPADPDEPATRPAADAGNATRPMPRRRAPTSGAARTFATHVAFEDVLAKATPLLPIAALPDAPGLDQPDRPIETTATVPPMTARRRTRALPVALAGLVAAVAAVALALSLDLGTTPTAAATTPDAAPPDAPAPPPDAPPPPVDAAASPIDAGAGKRPPRRPDAAPAPRARGTLKVGANPWGRVLIDGTYVADTPLLRELPVGRHRVIVRHPDLGEKSFDVDIRAGATQDVYADFTD